MWNANPVIAASIAASTSTRGGKPGAAALAPSPTALVAFVPLPRARTARARAFSHSVARALVASRPRARVSTRARGDACARTAPRVDRTARPEVDADVETTVPQRASASIARVVVCARARTRATTPRRA